MVLYLHFMKSSLLFFATCLFFSVHLPLKVSAQQGHWQEFQGQRTFGREDSRARLEQVLLDEARRKVVEQEVGIKVQSTEQNVKGEYSSRSTASGSTSRAWVEDFISFSKQESSGRIVEENKPVFTEENRDGQRVLSLNYQARVARDAGKRDPGFQVSFELNQESYREGDSLRMTAKSERTGWLYVFNVSRNGRFTLIWPNAYDRDHRLEAGRQQKLPMSAHRYAFVAELGEEAEGGRLSVGSNAMPDNFVASQTDLIFALFYIGDRPLLESQVISQGKEYSLGDFNRLLLNIDLSDRREVAVAYTTSRR